MIVQNRDLQFRALAPPRRLFQSSQLEFTKMVMHALLSVEFLADNLGTELLVTASSK
jgi:hypothetical protein